MPSKQIYYVLLFIAVTAASTASIMVRLCTSPPVVIAFWRMSISAIIMLIGAVILQQFNKKTFSIIKENYFALILTGIALALHFVTFFISLDLTTVAASTLFVNSSPIFAAILSIVLFREKPRRIAWLGIFLALIGAIIIANADFQVGSTYFMGDIFALVGGFFYASYLVGGRHVRKHLSNTTYTAIIYLVATIVLLPVVLFYEPIQWLLIDYVWLTGLVIVPTGLGHTLESFLLKKIKAYVIATVALLEPLIASTIAMFLFAEIPAPYVIIGGVVVSVGIITTIFSEKEQYEQENDENLVG